MIINYYFCRDVSVCLVSDPYYIHLSPNIFVNKEMLEMSVLTPNNLAVLYKKMTSTFSGAPNRWRNGNCSIIIPNNVPTWFRSRNKTYIYDISTSTWAKKSTIVQIPTISGYVYFVIFNFIWNFITQNNTWHCVEK